MAVIMVDYVLLPSQYDRVPELLKNVSGFAASVAYAGLGSSDRQLPGVVCAGFAKYLAHLSHQKVTAELTKAMQAVEQLAASDSSEVRNLVVTEIFDNMDVVSQRAVMPFMEKASRELFDRYVALR